MALPPDSSDLSQHPNAVSGLSASCTPSHTRALTPLCSLFLTQSIRHCSPMTQIHMQHWHHQPEWEKERGRLAKQGQAVAKRGDGGRTKCQIIIEDENPWNVQLNDKCIVQIFCQVASKWIGFIQIMICIADLTTKKVPVKSQIR